VREVALVRLDAHAPERAQAVADARLKDDVDWVRRQAELIAARRPAASAPA
jgi:hypothetical protein